MCAIVTSGTKKVGMSANGRCCIKEVLGEAANPGHMYNVPRKTARRKSAMPKKFQTRNPRPKRNRSSAATRAATNGAVTAMAMSPSPAGHANPTGKSPSA
jgi:hypothetical protein